MHTPPHRAVSLALVVQALGATKEAARQAARRPSVARPSSSSAFASSAGSDAAAPRDVELASVAAVEERAV